MTNIVQYSPEFKKTLKPLAKKYTTLKDSVKSLENALIKDPFAGEAYGDKIYKIRMSDESKGKGKSGGFRVMYYLLNETSEGIEVLMITIFYKSETSTIKKKAAVILKDYVLEKMGLSSKNRK